MQHYILRFKPSTLLLTDRDHLTADGEYCMFGTLRTNHLYSFLRIVTISVQMPRSVRSIPS